MPQQMRYSGLTLGLLTLGLLAGAALTASLAQAASGPGPYYAEPAWDRKLPATTRFLVLTDWNSEAVLDKETGLVWERLPTATTPRQWNTALVDCINRTTGNRQGWRLPSVHELASLLHPSVAPPFPLLQPGHPFLTGQLASFWSATTFADNPTDAWSVSFSDGAVNNAPKTNTLAAWCVRGGMNAEAY